MPAICTLPQAGTITKTGFAVEPTADRMIGSLVVNVIDELTATPAAPLTGNILSTVGAVVSGVDDAAVVKPIDCGVIVCNVKSRRPLTWTV